MSSLNKARIQMTFTVSIEAKSITQASQLLIELKRLKQQ